MAHVLKVALNEYILGQSITQIFHRSPADKSSYRCTHHGNLVQVAGRCWLILLILLPHPNSLSARIRKSVQRQFRQAGLHSGDLHLRACFDHLCYRTVVGRLEHRALGRWIGCSWALSGDSDRCGACCSYQEETSASVSSHQYVWCSFRSGANP